MIFVFGFSTPVRFEAFRVAVFNTVVIDYLAISFRTLGHFPLQKSKSILDILSYFLACFTLTCFAIEICYMAWVINGLHGIEEKNMSAGEKNIREIIFDGLNENSIKKSWFVRNYNLLYLLRFFVFVGFLFGLQYLQIFQALFSFILMISFTILTIYYQLTQGLFDSRASSIIKMIQECSIAVIMIMVNTFCLDSFRGFLNSKAKTVMVLVFMILILLNILLEFVSVVISLIEIFKRKKKRVIEKNQPVDQIGIVFDIGRNQERKKILEKKKNQKESTENEKKNDQDPFGVERENFLRERQEIIINSGRRNRRRGRKGKIKKSRKVM